MRNKAVIAAIALALLTAAPGAAAGAQPSSRDLANSKLEEGKAYLDAGKFADAESSFESVVDMNDPDDADLRAIAGVFLCLARAKNNEIDAARTACRNVLDMRDAPQAVKDQATTLLNKLD